MHAGIQQQLVGGMTTRRNRGSVGSLEGGRIFSDAMAWIAQQKVSSSYVTGISKHNEKHKQWWLKSMLG